MKLSTLYTYKRTAAHRQCIYAHMQKWEQGYMHVAALYCEMQPLRF